MNKKENKIDEKLDNIEVTSDVGGSTTAVKKQNIVVKTFHSVVAWFNGLNRWLRLSIMILVPVVFVLVGILVTLNGLLWYNPVSPETKSSEARDAHLFFEGDRLISYSHESDFNAEVIYDDKDKTDNSFKEVGFTSKKAINIDIPMNVNKIEVKIKETNSKDKKPLKTFDKIYKRKVDNPNIFTVATGHIHAGKKVDGTYKDIADAVENKDSASDEAKFISAIFLKRTPLEIVNALTGNKVTNAKLVVDKNSYKDYDKYFKTHQDPKDVHQVYWHVTAETNFKGQDSSLKNIEQHVLSRVVEFNYQGNDDNYDVFLIKSENGNDPTLGVKYGLLLSTDGYSFAGKDIDGKTWIKNDHFSAVPTHDTLGLYTIIVKADTTEAQTIAQNIASEIGGVN